MPREPDVGDHNARYLDNLVQLNPAFVEFSAELHRKNLIPVGTYVLDLDAHVHNAKSIFNEAKKRNIALYYMSKQIGRNPIIAQAVLNTGFRGLVSVEPQETRSLVRYGIRVAHVGHLVNVPENEIDYVLKVVKPEVITVFNAEKAKMISARARKFGIKQNLLIRAIGPKDICFPYMEGGIPEKDAINTIRKINSMPSVHVLGITSFPCLLFDIRKMRPVYTPNIETIFRVAREAKEHGLDLQQINTPPFCTTKTLKFYAVRGSTHCEPGMGVSGMSPWHCLEPKIHPEVPAGLYVSEVSHFVDEFAYIYGGGFSYIEIFEWALDGEVYVPPLSKLRMKALVNRKPEEILQGPVEAEHYRGILDYHAKLYRNDSVKIGDTVVCGFRTQMFVTRAQIAVVAGLRDNNPKLIGIFDQGNNLVDRFGHLLGERKVSELIERYSTDMT